MIMKFHNSDMFYKFVIVFTNFYMSSALACRVESIKPYVEKYYIIYILESYLPTNYSCDDAVNVIICYPP